MEDIKPYIEWVNCVPQFVWGSLGTILLGLIASAGNRYRKGQADQRKVLFRNLSTLLARDKGWVGVAGTNRITYLNQVVIDWTGGDDTLKVTMGGADQGSLLYPGNKKSILATAKTKLEELIEDSVQNKAAGVNMLVATLATQSQA